MKALFACLAMLCVSASEPESSARCQPAPMISPSVAATLPPHSTYVSDTEPPQRFSTSPRGPIEVYFGQDNIDAICGTPPCGKVFEGCVRGNQMAVQDPFSTPAADWMRVLRHELAHINGWPATHGD